MKVGQKHLRDDISRVQAVRELIGAEIHLMVDANMRWDAATAVRAAQQMSESDVFWLEEPTIPDDYPGHAIIAERGGLPIATGENFHTLYEFRHMIEYGRIAYPEPDVSNIGGITNWMRVAKLAYANNLQVTSHGVHELHLHLLAAIPNASFLEVHSFGLERFITNPPEIQDGQMTAADGAGHGVLFDWAALEPYFVDNGKGTR
jgi:L-alanine-DL-glutamate epimerase-like enolase superfamily enzyme